MTRNVNVGAVPLYVRVVRVLMKSIGASVPVELAAGDFADWQHAIALTGAGLVRDGSGDFCFTRSAVACLSAF